MTTERRSTKDEMLGGALAKQQLVPQLSVRKEARALSPASPEAAVIKPEEPNGATRANPLPFALPPEPR